MNQARILPAALKGSIGAISSKSQLHRLLLCAALGDRPTRIAGCCLSEDIRATMACIEALGAGCGLEGDAILVEPIKTPPRRALLNCAESGSTLRFLLPVAAALCEESCFTGTGRLPKRPVGPLLQCLSQLGGRFDREDGLPLRVYGPIHGGACRAPGNVSSQYISGLLLALPLLREGGEIQLTTPLASAGYVDMTLGVLERFGIGVEGLPQGYRVPAGQRYASPGSLRVEGDWSNAAFFLAAGALGKEPLQVTNLSLDSRQGDKAILELLARFGASVAAEGDAVTVGPGSLRGIAIDAEHIPDLVPILSIVAAFAAGETRISGASRLRLKESDRIASVLAMLQSFGVEAEELPDGLVIRGGKGLRGAVVDSFHDHRIAMAAAIGALSAQGESRILDPMAAAKSYPDFYEDYNRLGGKADVHILG